MAENPFYVYALKDSRIKPARIFYIGKGTGTRAWEHQLFNDDSDKGRLIKSILKSGNKVIHTIISDNLTENQALKIEAELISAFGISSKGGLLTNKINPNTEIVSTKGKVNVPDGCYERAQIGLEFLKSAIIEMAKANPEGIKNSDASKYLGLQSDYGGGSKDYLSYSILGILLKQKLMERLPGGKHKSTKD